MEILKVKKLNPNATLPTKATTHAAAFDLYSAEDAFLSQDEFRLVDTGIAMEIPSGYFGYIRPRSGKATKEGLVLRSSNVIDADYRASVKIGCYALGVKNLSIKAGERIAQILLLPVPEFAVEEVTELSETNRGTGGFGSTGRS